MTNKCVYENIDVSQNNFTITEAGWTKITVNNRVLREMFMISIKKLETPIEVLITQDPTLSDDKALSFYTGMTLMNELTYLNKDVYLKLASAGSVNVAVWQSVFDGMR